MSGVYPSGENQTIVITGVGVISPEAMSVPELADGPTGDPIQPGTGVIRPLDRFDPERFLGKRGFKYLNPATRYAVACSRLATDDAGLAEESYKAEEKGVFLGTTCAVNETLDSLDHTIVNEGAESLQPMEAPNFSVNLAASNISMRQQFKAFNVTLTSALVSGLEAVIFGAQSIRRSRARLVLAGAVEGKPPERLVSLLGSPLAEGAACLLALESLSDARARGARSYARVGGTALCFIPPGIADEEAEQVAWIIEGHLDRIIQPGQEQVYLSLLDLDYPVCQVVNQVIRQSLERRGIQLSVLPRQAAGEISVSPLLSLVTSAAIHGQGLVVAVSPHGQVALVNLEPVGPNEQQEEC